MPAGSRSRGRRSRRRSQLSLVYAFHAACATYERHLPWLRRGDERLAAIRTRSRVLRRWRHGRRAWTQILPVLLDAAPGDFCATVTAWQAAGFAGRLEAARRVVGALRAAPVGFVRSHIRADRLIRRHGASRAERDAFAGVVRWPDVRPPAPDPVAALLGHATLPEPAATAR